MIQRQKLDLSKVKYEECIKRKGQNMEEKDESKMSDI